MDRRSAFVIAAFGLVSACWLLVFVLPPKGDIDQLSGEPIQIAISTILVVLIAMMMWSERVHFSQRVWLILAGFTALDVVCGSFLCSGLAAAAQHFGVGTTSIVYLDTIGCVSVSLLLGPEWGVASAALYYLIMLPIAPGLILFAPVNLTAAYCAGKFRELGGMTSWWTSAISGLLVGLVCALLTAPINITVFGPIVGEGEPVTAQFLNELKYTTVGGLVGDGFSDPLDKMVTYVVGGFIAVWLARRLSSTAPASPRPEHAAPPVRGHKQ